MPVPPDGPLPLARRRLEDAVHALADPIPVWDRGACRWADALYTRLRDALDGRSVALGGRSTAGRSRAPLRVDVLTLLITIDTTSASWEPHGKTTVDRLYQLAARGWRPQDCERIEGYGATIARWVIGASELLDRRPVVHLPQPCPACEASWAYRDASSGGRIRSRALRVSEDGCFCGACRAFWPPSEFAWLARLFGCEPVLA